MSIFLFENNIKLIIILVKIIFYTCVISFLLTVIINPGIPKRETFSKKVEREYKGDFSTLRKCDKCNIILPMTIKVEHCSFCNICILNRDHHCPWIGKCVGRYNIVQFCVFFTFLYLFIICSIIVLIIYIKRHY